MAAPRKYPDELRERAVRLYRESSPRPSFRPLGEQLNIHPEALRGWIRQAEVCLVAAYLRIRGVDPVGHRRWMIRAYAVGTARGHHAHRPRGSGGAPRLGLRAAFPVAFWIGFGINVILAEWWLKRAPTLAR